MFDELSEELDRIGARASSPAPPWLAVLEVEPIDGVETYGRKLREVAGAAVGMARNADFDADALDSSGIPRWFAQLTDGCETEEGSAEYFRARGSASGIFKNGSSVSNLSYEGGRGGT